MGAEAEHSISQRQKDAIAKRHALENAYVIDIGCVNERLTRYLIRRPLHSFRKARASTAWIAIPPHTCIPLSAVCGEDKVILAQMNDAVRRKSPPGRTRNICGLECLWSEYGFEIHVSIDFHHAAQMRFDIQFSE